MKISFILKNFLCLFSCFIALVCFCPHGLCSDDEISELMGEYEEQGKENYIADPLYYFNYAMYTINDKLYFYALKPAAKCYKAVIPDPVRQCTKNFFHNLLFPVRFVNNLMQGKVKNAGTEFEIFFINSTVGFLGMGQVAQEALELKTNNEDLGQTLSSYNIGDGFYLVLPFFGPSTLRDTVGIVGDHFLTPLNYVKPADLSTGIKLYDTINATSFRIGDYEMLKEAAIDPYESIKNGYIQNRLKKIEDEHLFNINLP